MLSALRDDSDLSQHPRARPCTGSGEELRARQHQHQHADAAAAGRAVWWRERGCASHGWFACPAGARAGDGEVCVCRQRGTCPPAVRVPGGRFLQAASGGLRPPVPQQLRRSQGSGRRFGGGGKGGLKIDSNSPERRHGAIPGTFPPHPVTLLAKQSRARKGLARGPRGGGCEELPEGGRGRGAARAGAPWHRHRSPRHPPGPPPVHTGPREGEALAQMLSQGLFTGGTGRYCFWLQAPKLTKFWEILSSVTCGGSAVSS